jgi:hypothetical protein
VPKIIDYDEVLARMTAAGAKCVYPNSGAFGFAAGEAGRIVGWVGAADSTIRPGLAAEMVHFEPPSADNMARRLVETWLSEYPGPLWLVPKSHWSFELQHGNGPWLSPLLIDAKIDPAALQERTNAAAIEFPPAEADFLPPIVAALLQRLTQSDFAILFPGRSVLVTLHHHGQVWWQFPVT